MLSVDDAHRRLLKWSLIDTASICHGNLSVTSWPRRNLNLVVRHRDGSGYLLKQPDPSVSETKKTILNEGRFLDFCRNDDRVLGLTRYLPSSHLFIPEESVLVVELENDTHHLWEEYEARGNGEMELGPPRALGAALATLHSTFSGPEFGEDPRLVDLTTAQPPFFAIHRPEPWMFRGLSGANHELCRILQSKSEIKTTLDEIAKLWRRETLVHGDIRSSNVLVRSAPRREQKEILLVDWEFVQFGDRAWDLAAVFADFALFWILGMSTAPDLTAEERVASAEFSLAALRPAVRRFWRSYVCETDLETSYASDLLRRSAFFTITKLIQLAWEFSTDGSSLAYETRLLLQIALNALPSPIQAVGSMYGLSEWLEK